MKLEKISYAEFKDQAKKRAELEIEERLSEIEALVQLTAYLNIDTTVILKQLSAIRKLLTH